MATSNKPEIYFEIGTGFFRIPTSEANYNITVLDSGQSAVTRVVEKIVETERNGASPEEVMEAVSEGFAAAGDDDFYKNVSSELYKDIGQLAKNLSSTIMDIPAEDRMGKRAELDEAGEKIEQAKSQLKDIVEMTEKAAMEIMDNVENVQAGSNDARELLLSLKNHRAFSQSEAEAENNADAESGSLRDETEILQSRMNEALELLSAMQGEGGRQEVAAVSEVQKETKTRYLFDLDVVFQTLYELCTNETVKEHITSARQSAAKFFVLDSFYDAIAPKAATYEADSDNFYTVPMSDVFTSLMAGCTDKGTSNLLKKMDAGQSSIFLDQSIPLEVPPTEEIEVEIDAPVDVPPAEPVAEADPRIDKVKELLVDALQTVDSLPDRAAKGCSTGNIMTFEDRDDIFEKIEASFGVASTISADVAKIAVALSFQDLSGQQIMKIIKLLSDFQIQLLALVVSFGSQLKQREKNASISVEESKKLAQEDVDGYIAKITSGAEEEGGVLDQDNVNKMLEDMGF